MRHSVSALVLLASASLLLTGCLSRPALVKQSFVFASPPIDSSPATAAGRVLAVKTPVISPLFEGKALVYRTGENSYELDPYAEWLVPPSRSLVVPIRAYLRNSGAFRDVAEAESAVKPDLRMEVYASELYGDFREPNAPTAVLTLRLLFFEASPGAASKVVLQKDCSRRVLIKERTAAALIEGWNQGLTQILAEIVTALKAAHL